MKKTVLSLLLLAASLPSLFAQIHDPIQWEHALYDNEDGTYELVHTATLEDHWHIYSQALDPNDGPIPTSFYFETEGVTSDSIAQECEPIFEYDPNFMMDLKFFGGTVQWWQTVAFETTAPDTLKGFKYFMVCDDSMCLPPDEVPFSVALADANSANDLPEFCPSTGDQNDTKSNGIFMLFILGMGLGFVALLTPCVFPMIPMTVSFFTKQSKTKSQGIRNAGIYGLSIIGI